MKRRWRFSVRAAALLMTGLIRSVESLLRTQWLTIGGCHKDVIRRISIVKSRCRPICWTFYDLDLKD